MKHRPGSEGEREAMASVSFEGEGTMKVGELIESLRDPLMTHKECKQAATMLERFIALADELESEAKKEAKYGTPMMHARARRSRKIAKRIREIAEGEA